MFKPPTDTDEVCCAREYAEHICAMDKANAKHSFPTMGVRGEVITSPGYSLGNCRKIFYSSYFVFKITFSPLLLRGGEYKGGNFYLYLLQDFLNFLIMVDSISVDDVKKAIVLQRILKRLSNYPNVMRTRKVSAYVFSYPVNAKIPMLALFLDELGEVLEFEDKFLSDKPLDELLKIYEDKASVFASFDDNIKWYRVIVRDTDGRLVKIFKA